MRIEYIIGFFLNFNVYTHYIPITEVELKPLVIGSLSNDKRMKKRNLYNKSFSRNSKANFI